MILVTLGTQDKPFTRLLDTLEKLISKRIIKDEVIVQAGHTKYDSKYMKVFDLISQEELDHLVKTCDLLITHGGVGSILAGIKNNKRVIAIPRLAEYGEHTNNHQMQIVERFTKEGYILGIKNPSQLEKALKKVYKFQPKTFQSNTDNMINLIEKYIDETKKKKMFERGKGLLQKYNEIISYLIFGVLTTGIGLCIYYALVYTILNPNDAIELQIANIISWIGSVTFAYVTNRIFVFKSKNKNRVKELTGFVASRIITLVMDMIIMFFGVTIFHGNDKVMKLLAQVVVIIANYIFSKLFVFKKKTSD